MEHLSMRVSQSSSDVVGQALSLLCLIHCAVTPVVLMVAPAAMGIFGNAHPVLLVLVATTALWAFIPGYRHHRSLPVLVLGVAGLSLLVVGSLVFHSSFVLDTAFTVSGAGLMLAAHWKNRVAHRACHACAGDVAIV
jgi:hypothetical protein